MDRLRALAERRPWLGTVLDVHERVGETNGSATASATTLTFFVSLFPLILVVIAAVGFASAGDPDVTDRIVDNLGLTGDAAEQIRTAIGRAEQSRRAASIIGLVGLLWSGLGVTTALTMAVRTPWQRKPPGLRAKLDGVVWVLGGALTFGGSLLLGAVLNVLPDAIPKIASSLLVVALGLVLEAAFFLWTFWALGERRAGWRAVLPGAVVGAVGFEILKVVGTVLVPRMVASSSSLYGPLGVVFAILAWLALFSRLLVYASALNAVLFERTTGTVTLVVKALRFEGEIPVGADRGGAVLGPRAPDA